MTDNPSETSCRWSPASDLAAPGQATNGVEVLAATSSALTNRAANQVEKLRNESAVIVLLLAHAAPDRRR